jgi:hypothetical protein
LADARSARSRRLARRLLDAAPGDVSERLARITSGTATMSLALYESECPSVRVEMRGGVEDGSAPSVSIDAAIGYRFAIIMGTTASVPDWPELDEAVGAAPSRAWVPDPWFTTRRLVPDAWIASHADAQSLAHWVRLTGRAGDRDAYWFPETWERFLESGTHVGHLTPMDVWRSRRSGSGRQHGADGSSLSADGNPLYISPLDVSSFNPAVERGVGVPPGYGLAECRGKLEVAVLAV